MTHTSETRVFPLGQIPSVTGEILVAEGGIGGVYEICNWLAGESLMTHQLVRAHRVFGPELLRQHPRLAEVDDSGCGPDTWRDWLASQKRLFGDALTVAKPAPGLWEYQHPMAELRDMVGPDKPIIALGADPGREN